MPVYDVQFIVQVSTEEDSIEEVDDMIKTFRNKLKENFKVKTLNIQYTEAIAYTKPNGTLKPVPMQ